MKTSETTLSICLPYFCQKVLIPLTVSSTIFFTSGHTFLAIASTFEKTSFTHFQTVFKACTTAALMRSPFSSHHAFIALATLIMTDLIFSHMRITAFRKSSFVFHKYTSKATTAAIAMPMSPAFVNRTFATLMIVPRLPTSFPITTSNGPIAAASSAMTTICFLVPIDSPIIFAVSGEIYFVINCRMSGISTSPNEIAISSSSDFRIFHCPCKVSSCVAAMSVALFVPVMALVIPLTASPPADIKASIPGPPLAPKISIACAVSNPASRNLSRIDAKSLVAGFTSSTAMPSSSKIPSAAVDGFIRDTNACRSEVPAVLPS